MRGAKEACEDGKGAESETSIACHSLRGSERRTIKNLRRLLKMQRSQRSLHSAKVSSEKNGFIYVIGVQETAVAAVVEDDDVAQTTANV